MSLKLSDMTQVLQLTTRKGVGSQRWQRPQYVHFLPPCNHACPAGEDIQGWLAYAQAGEYEKAWHRLVENNPLPATHGRACYHPCEGGCNRGHLDVDGKVRSGAEHALRNAPAAHVDRPAFRKAERVARRQHGRLDSRRSGEVPAGGGRRRNDGFVVARTWSPPSRNAAERPARLDGRPRLRFDRCAQGPARGFAPPCRPRSVHAGAVLPDSDGGSLPRATITRHSGRYTEHANHAI